MDLSQRASQMAQHGQLNLAIALLQQGIDNGDGSAAFLLANWRFEGQLIRRDLPEARKLLELSHALGCLDAELPLMALMATGVGGSTREWTASLAMLRHRSSRDTQSQRHSELIAAMSVDARGDPQIRFEPVLISDDPLIVKFDDFLSHSECDALVDLAEHSLGPSLVVHPDSGELVRNTIRTSSAAAFPLMQEGPFLHAINRRIAIASRSAWAQGEPTQILHYAVGEEYKLHSDALAAGNQRIQTFLIYLTDDFGGGETYFPHRDLRLRLPKGHAICFSNVSSDMRPSPNAIHAGMPVTRGRKVILSKWIRQNPLDLTGPPNKPF